MFGPQHPEWLEYSRAIRRKIDAAVTELESPVDIDQTNFIRGKLAALRELLSAEDAPAIGAPPPSYNT